MFLVDCQLSPDVIVWEVETVVGASDPSVGLRSVRVSYAYTYTYTIQVQTLDLQTETRIETHLSLFSLPANHIRAQLAVDQ